MTGTHKLKSVNAIQKVLSLDSANRNRVLNIFLDQAIKLKYPDKIQRIFIELQSDKAARTLARSIERLKSKKK